MVSGDIALRLLISGSADVAISAMNALGGVIGKIFGGMGNSIGNIIFGFKNLGTAGTIGMDAIKQGASGLAMGLVSLLAILALVAVAIAVGLGIAGVKAAADFQQGLNRLVTGAGDVTDNMQKMGQAILGVSVNTGLLTSGTDGLNAAMYQIISSGQRGAQSIDTLSVSAMGAQIEQAKLVDVAKALTTAMTDYGTKQFNATQFMNGYIVAVQRGKITLEELSNTMGPLLPLAKNLGISFADVAGAMSTMTNAGIPAARAATSLRFLFQSIENPTHKASTAMLKFGLDSVAVANEMKTSLPGALQMVYSAALRAGPEGSVPFNRAISDMIGGSRSLQAYLALTGSHMKDFASNAAAVATAMKSSSGGVLGWQTALSNLNVWMDRGKAAFQALLITIGTALLPVITRFVSAVTPAITAFANWVIQSHIIDNVLSALGVVFSTIGAILTPVIGLFMQFMGVLGRLIEWVQHNQTAMLAFKIILMAIGALIAGVIILALIAIVAILAALAIAIGIVVAIIMGVIWVFQHWGDIMHWVGGIFSWLGTQAHNAVTTIGGWFDWLGTHVHDFITGVKNTVGGWFDWLGTQAHNAVNTVGGWFDWLGTQVHDFIEGVKKFFTAFGDWLYKHNTYVQAVVDGLNDAKNKIGAFFDWLGTHVKGVFDAIGTHVGDFFSWLGTQANNGTQTVGGFFDWLGTHTNQAWDFVRTHVGDFFSWLGTQANGGTQNVGGFFDWLGTHVGGVWDGLRTMVGGWFSWLGTFVNTQLTNIGSFFSQAGTNFMNMLGNAMQAAAGAVINAATGIANKLKSLLGFHSPTKEGPGSSAHLWMPALVDMMAAGLIAGIPRMASAASMMAAVLSPLLSSHPSFSVSSSSYAPGGGSFALAPGGGSFAVGGSSGGQHIHVHNYPAPIYLDKRQIGQILFDYQATELRRQGLVKR
jgi:TP901 family phage tail tape measure protein